VKAGTIEFLDHPADLRMRVMAPTLEALFERSAEGLFQVITDVQRVMPMKRQTVSVSAVSSEDLLILWLQEWLYAFHTERYVFARFHAEVLKVSERQWSCQGTGEGEPIHPERHALSSREVKAVTYHGVQIKKVKDQWMVEVVLDV